MHAIEFEAVAVQHKVRLPDQIPDGVKLRVLVLLEDDAQDVGAESSSVVGTLNKPSPRLAGSVVMHDDLLAPAVPEEDWSAVQ